MLKQLHGGAGTKDLGYFFGGDLKNLWIMPCLKRWLNLEKNLPLIFLAMWQSRILKIWKRSQTKFNECLIMDILSQCPKKH